MRVILSLLVFLVTAAIIGGVCVFVWGYGAYKKPGPLQERVLFVVERGQGVSQIADRLSHAHVIRNPLLFRVMARLTDRHTDLKAGEYEFLPGLRMEDILRQLAAGKIYQRMMTVPEGLTSRQVVQIVNATEGLEGAIADMPPEGSLLPETYSYVKGDTRQAKIAQMQTAMTGLVDALWLKRAANLLLSSKEEAVILASIVEKETGIPAERNRVAGVFINRLRRGIALQSDPTVIYAMTKGEIKSGGQGPLGRKLYTKDLKFESPYNTYKYAGLPPGPIANPGRESLAAVLNPEAHDYLYFVADGSGGHVFAKTLADHNRNVANWRKIRKQQK